MRNSKHIKIIALINIRYVNSSQTSCGISAIMNCNFTNLCDITHITYLEHVWLKCLWKLHVWNNNHISHLHEVDDLTRWGRVTHICINKLTTFGSDNGLSPGRRQAIIWTNAGILLIGPLRTNLSEILIKILIFPFKKMRLKVSAKWWPFCLGLNVLTHCALERPHGISKKGQHYLRYWLVACSAPSHYLNQCWHIVNRTPRSKIQWYFEQNTMFSSEKMLLIMLSVRCWSFCSSPNVLINARNKIIHSLQWIMIFGVTRELICQWFSWVTNSLVNIIGKSPHSWPKNRYSR